MKGRTTPADVRAAIRRLMVDEGLTRRQTAERLGISFSTVARYATGLGTPGGRWKRPELLLYLDAAGFDRGRIAEELRLSRGAVYAATRRAQRAAAQ